MNDTTIELRDDDRPDRADDGCGRRIWANREN
jgi:hypothetical protein